MTQTRDSLVRHVRAKEHEEPHWLTPAIAGFFALAALSVLPASTSTVGVIAPALFLLQGIMLAVGLRRHPVRDQIVWGAQLLGIGFLALKSYAFVQYVHAHGQTTRPLPHSAEVWRAVMIAATLANLVCFIWSAARGFRPLLHVPATRRSIRVALAGFAVVEMTTQWMWFDDTVNGLAWQIMALCCAAAATALIGSLVTLGPILRRLNRPADLLILSAGVLFAVGQATLMLTHESRLLTPNLAFVHPLIATGIVAAAAFRPGMGRFGSPLTEYTDRPMTNVSSAVLMAVSVADAALAGLAKGPWAGSTIVLVLASVVAAQTVLIVWLSGMLLSILGRLGRFRNRRLRAELRSALTRDELVAHFQPIVRAEDQTLVGYETLARWNHPRLGLITAARFIGIASDEGLLATIDHMMMRMAAEALPTLFACNPGQPLFLTVNVEPQRMQQAGFAVRVLEELHARKLDPKGLIIEITETAAIDDWDEIRRNVSIFQAAGIGLAIDDFGAGHSNFGLLVELEPDLVKLDQSLVEAALATNRGRAVVRNAVQAARSCGASIVAEGVSDGTWCPSLEALGFDHVQGYAFGRAAAASSFH